MKIRRGSFYRIYVVDRLYADDPSLAVSHGQLIAYADDGAWRDTSGKVIDGKQFDIVKYVGAIESGDK